MCIVSEISDGKQLCCKKWRERVLQSVNPGMALRFLRALEEDMESFIFVFVRHQMLYTRMLPAE